MELFRDWAMTIAGIVVFGSACEVILPDGSFRKYTRLAIGLVLIVTMLSPWKDVRKGDVELSIPEIAAEAYQQRESMEQTQQEDVIKLYRQTLSRKMEAALQESLGEVTVKVLCQVEEEDPDTFGTVQKVEVSVKAKEEPATQDRIAEILHRDFGINPKRITVRYLKESEE